MLGGCGASWSVVTQMAGAVRGNSPEDVTTQLSSLFPQVDQMVPIAHGEWLSQQLTDVQKHLEDDHGHVSLTVEKAGEMVDVLKARLARPAG